MEQIRSAGHSALAVIVEQYKEQSRLSVAEQQQRNETLMRETINSEQVKAEGLLKEQHERLSAALMEEQSKQQEKIIIALEEAQQQHQVSFISVGVANSSHTGSNVYCYW